MINDLHVSLITQLKGAQREGESHSQQDERSCAPLASLCSPRRAAADLRMLKKKEHASRISNQSDKVKQRRRFRGA